MTAFGRARYSAVMLKGDTQMICVERIPMLAARLEEAQKAKVNCENQAVTYINESRNAGKKSDSRPTDIGMLQLVEALVLATENPVWATETEQRVDA
jgi:hypothetical protein